MSEHSSSKRMIVTGVGLVAVAVGLYFANLALAERLGSGRVNQLIPLLFAVIGVYFVVFATRHLAGAAPAPARPMQKLKAIGMVVLFLVADLVLQGLAALR